MKKRKREVSLVVFGTPIFLGDEENKDAMKIQSKYTPEHQQVVKDENGRRRFHGAFTGGFSAGYFNTVGSVEVIPISY
jgi:G patch domain-containing protein 1